MPPHIHTINQLNAEMDRLWWERQRLNFIWWAWAQFLDSDGDNDNSAMWLNLFEAAFIEHEH